MFEFFWEDNDLKIKTEWETADAGIWNPATSTLYFFTKNGDVFRTEFDHKPDAHDILGSIWEGTFDE